MGPHEVCGGEDGVGCEQAGEVVEPARERVLAVGVDVETVEAEVGCEGDRTRLLVAGDAEAVRVGGEDVDLVS